MLNMLEYSNISCRFAQRKFRIFLIIITMKEKTIKDIEKGLVSIANSKGLDLATVFSDFLDYTIGFFSPTRYIIDGWKLKYGNGENEMFFRTMLGFLKLASDEIERHGWFDGFGDLFMSMHVNGNNNGQFFTPTALCDLMAMTTIKEDAIGVKQGKTPFGRRAIVSDPTCGSGRNLLAVHAKYITIGLERPYLVGEDLDMNCCKMTAINLCIHGCFGEVVCHDTLNEPGKVRAGWIVNETMYPFPSNVPSIRRCDTTHLLYVK